jgi:hypothetical protein
MPLFNDSVCPQCGGALPLKALWLFAQAEDPHIFTAFKFLGRSGLFRGRVGLECPKCGAKLLLVQTRIRVLLILLWGCTLGAFALLGTWLRSRGLAPNQLLVGFVVLCGLFAALTLQRRLIPHMADVRLITDAEGVSFPLRAAYDSAATHGQKSARGI